ncbi:hypothetical protein CXB51_017020 [Gossypium anomalum]|uniref:Uncharacterized protein n=1 Tax=Gossypium anomalum TaxID=47600 RepID=A0A8J6CVI6_9ROSI|nr:hypothetical protein CXB51_017020 [Gossypium anomalum]
MRVFLLMRHRQTLLIKLLIEANEYLWLYTIQWMLCMLWEMKFQKKDELYFFAIKMFQMPMFLNLDPDNRVWWLRRVYVEKNPNTSFSFLLATSLFPFQPFYQPAPP